MKKLFYLTLLISNYFFAQNDSSNTEVPFEVVENVPVYQGCDEKLSNAVLRKCMSEKISQHIAKNFRTDLVKGLGLPDGITKIYANFKVNKKGKLEDIKANADHVVLEKEAVRVIKKISKMTRPGIVRGKPVSVPYALPIAFLVDNSKYKK